MLVKNDINGCWVDGEPSYISVGSRAFEKMAAYDIYVPPRIKAAAEQYRRDPKYACVVVHGLGSSEGWGENRNTDLFPEYISKEAHLLHNTDAFGYRSFEKHAHPFRNHNNKDPKLAIGEKIACADWNDKMRRVEVMVKVARDVAPDIADAIDRDEPLMWSMGCRVPFDECTKCGNRAKTAADYCECLRNHRGEVLPNGVKIGMTNHKPVFFDMSQVPRGADRSAYSLSKVASWSAVTCAQTPRFRVPAEKVAVLINGTKQAERTVEAEHEKEVAMTSGAQPAPTDIFEKLRELAGNIDGEEADQCAALAGNDMKSKPPAMQIMIRAQGQGAAKLLPLLAQLGIIPTPHEVKAAGWSAADIPDILAFTPVKLSAVADLMPIVPDRSLYTPAFASRLMRQPVKVAADIEAPGAYTAVLSCYINTLLSPARAAWEKTAADMAVTVSQLAGLAHGVKLAAREDAPDKDGGKPGVSSKMLHAMLIPLLLGSLYNVQQSGGAQLSGLQQYLANNQLPAALIAALMTRKLSH